MLQYITPARVRRTLQTSNSKPKTRSSGSVSPVRPSKKRVQPAPAVLTLQKLNQFCAEVQRTHQRGELQKCVQHGNYLSGFCKECKEVLCPNCVFNKGAHRHHKIVPLSGAESELTKTNQRLLNKVHQTIDALDIVQNTCSNNFIAFESNRNRCLNEIKDQFSGLTRFLKDKQLQFEDSVCRLFDQARQQSSFFNSQAIEYKRFLTDQITKKGMRHSSDQAIFQNYLLNKLANLSPDLVLEKENLHSKPLFRQSLLSQVRPLFAELDLEGQTACVPLAPPSDLGPFFKVSHYLSQQNVRNLT